MIVASTFSAGSVWIVGAIVAAVAIAVAVLIKKKK